MSPTITRTVGILVLLALSLMLASGPLQIPWLMYCFKPLASALIFAIPFVQWRKHRSPFIFWITIGLLFSFVGDVLLIFPDRLFIYGLVAFLFAHISFLIAFSREVKFPAHLFLWFLYLAVFAAYFFFVLFPTLSSDLRLPVIVYVFFVSTMGAQAMGRFFILKNRPACFAAIGALFFLLSDSLLAFDRFRSPIPASVFFVLIPYYLALWLIALSTQSLESANPRKINVIQLILI